MLTYQYAVLYEPLIHLFAVDVKYLGLGLRLKLPIATVYLVIGQALLPRQYTTGSNGTSNESKVVRKLRLLLR